MHIIIIVAAIVFLVWNGIVFFLYKADKAKAQSGQWRISEATLILCAFLMGGLGALLGMKLLRHKTKHLKFKVLVPLAVIVNIFVIVLSLYIAVL
ncbi:MAG: DUF1294 domain-containing protein [Defluviitaleaceae bacterium]|nr:DUF1294 domain-containing protein [Defluviitaleaceae bacterium]MCL2263680.1 DUF1294 domain-containing protein [Defluviitaleaceae bacterium]